MNPFRFGPAARQLYGVFHPAAPARTKGVGVLVCNPLGQEAVRFHRMLRVLSDRLASGGIGVLRFDYFGVGESAGEDEDGELHGWRDDVLLAHNELLRRSRATRVIWLGARLGATIAALASSQLPSPVDRLILWEPVVDGHQYLGELNAAHGRAMAEAGALRTSAVKPAIVDEALGFGVGAALLDQLGQLAPADLEAAKAKQLTLVLPPHHAAGAALAQGLSRAGLQTHVDEFSHVFDWSSEEALSTALVPAPVLEMLATHIGAAADE
ncbi:alpha/beta hydrolase [Rhizobacter sp. AJA081-3]|uniref:serine aminopeptidase domain-containing protein n=1 Tax=Rhizobacter sp. AJA081-3 TaxID=2753607 RepID=UPI001ADFCEAC|nr:alpha/beta hydrolase [Rhizobacter sp. AJA081-3]QTN24631.1 alpha/beta hydrolase [Rhizobacter sp. AJA081-3]